MVMLILTLMNQQLLQKQHTSPIMVYAAVEFNADKDFRDVNVSQGWWSYDYETVAIHEVDM